MPSRQKVYVCVFVCACVCHITLIKESALVSVSVSLFEEWWVDFSHFSMIANSPHLVVSKRVLRASSSRGGCSSCCFWRKRTRRAVASWHVLKAMCRLVWKSSVRLRTRLSGVVGSSNMASKGKWEACASVHSISTDVRSKRSLWRWAWVLSTKLAKCSGVHKWAARLANVCRLTSKKRLIFSRASSCRSWMKNDI